MKTPVNKELSKNKTRTNNNRKKSIKSRLSRRFNKPENFVYQQSENFIEQPHQARPNPNTPLNPTIFFWHM